MILHEKSAITIFLIFFTGQAAIPVPGKLPNTLPKNGEHGRHSVGFCRIPACNIDLFPLAPLLNAVLSIDSESLPWNAYRWHAVCSLIRNIKDWLPGVAGTDPRLGYRFGASITKRGLAPAPFFIFYPSSNKPFDQVPPASISIDSQTGRQV